MAVSDWSATASNNTSIDGVNIAENCAPGNLNNAIRSVMAGIRSLFPDYWLSIFAKVTNTDLRNQIGAAASGTNSDITSLQSSCTGTTQNAGDNSTKLATTAYADAIGAKAYGIGQSWGGYVGQRTVGGVYTNDVNRRSKVTPYRRAKGTPLGVAPSLMLGASFALLVA